MVDLGVRLGLLEDAAGDGRTACVLLDVVFGHGAHADPAGELAPAVAPGGRARDRRDRARVRHRRRPAGRARQAATLREAGAMVAPSNAAAARLAARAVA